jgi:hypothetical protein
VKHKTKTYILIVLVLGIWGIIGYKIMSAANPTTPKVGPNTFGVSFNPKLKTEQDTFSIQVAQRDPFLGTLLTKKKTKQKKTLKKPKAAPFVWVPIIYHGNIAKQDHKNEVFIISISGQQYLIKQEQVIKDVKLISGNSKSITVNYKGQRKVFTKT